MVTIQEFFDKAAIHLINQGYKSKNDEGDCMYRDGSGGMCAIGACIPDERYNKDMEYDAISNVVYNFHLEDIIPDVNLAKELQKIHDDFLVGHWRYRLFDIAYIFNLDDSKLREAIAEKESKNV